MLRQGLLRGDVDVFPFVLARDLGLTLGAVRAMPHDELVEWACFYRVERRVKKIWAGG